MVSLFKQLELVTFIENFSVRDLNTMAPRKWFFYIKFISIICFVRNSYCIIKFTEFCLRVNINFFFNFVHFLIYYFTQELISFFKIKYLLLLRCYVFNVHKKNFNQYDSIENIHCQKNYTKTNIYQPSNKFKTTRNSVSNFTILNYIIITAVP